MNKGGSGQSKEEWDDFLDSPVKKLKESEDGQADAASPMDRARQNKYLTLIAVLFAVVLVVGGFMFSRSGTTDLGEDVGTADNPERTTPSTKQPQSLGVGDGEVLQLDVAPGALGVVPSDGEMTVLWDGSGEGTQPVIASHVSEEKPITAVSGTLVLNPGDEPSEVSGPGGVFFHVYAEPGTGTDGGKDAQVGFINANGSAEVDGATGVCVSDSCYGTGADYLNNGNIALDATEGLNFRFTADGGQLTLEIQSVADPSQTSSTTSVFGDDISAISLDIWGTEWPFYASLSNLQVEY